MTHTARAHVAGPLEELPEGTHRVFAINGVEIGVFNVRGRLYAIPNYCFHQGGPLCEGKVGATIRADRASGWTPQWAQDGEIVVCPGTAWNSTSRRRCLARRRGRLRQYPVYVEDGQVVLVA